MPDKPVRINKYLADRGLCSRREAEELILKGWVKVNGAVLKELSYRVQENDKVEVASEASKHLNKKLTLIINKPLGYVSAQAEGDYKPAIRLVLKENFAGQGKAPFIHYQGFAPVGRLDIDSTGLLILTQEGRLAQKVIGPQSEIEKEYVLLVKGTVTEKKIKQLRHGLKLDGKSLRPAQVFHEEDQKIRMILTEGKKRQIRRMCELVDLQVTSLRRVRIGPLRLGDLPLGQWRLLTPNESKQFLSSK